MSQPLNVLVLQSDLESARGLVDFLKKRGDQVWQTSNLIEAGSLLEQKVPGLVVMDLHLPGHDWIDLLRRIRQQFPDTKILITSHHPDFRRELLVKEQNVRVFLRQPFTREWIERALQRLERDSQATSADTALQAPLPPVRVPVGVKITLPYTLLALAFAIAAAVLVSQYVLESIRDRFIVQLTGAGQLAADSMVQEEDRQLETLRLVAHTQGLPEALSAGDAERLRALTLPIAVNQRAEAVDILDPRAQSVLSLRRASTDPVEDFHSTRGDDVFAQWAFVRRVLEQQTDSQGDKYAGVVEAPWGRYFYIAGPILDGNGNLAGVVLVGTSLPTLAGQIRQDTRAHVTLYGVNGEPAYSTLFGAPDLRPLTPQQAAEVLQRQDSSSLIRGVADANNPYGEIVGPWEARGGQDLGLIGTALVQSVLVQPSVVTRLQAFLVVALAFVLVIAIGIYLAGQITRPLSQMVRASVQVALGNFDVKVDTKGNDEVAVLAHSFNYMVSGLQEGFIYRDLLGRAVSPEVREELREVFASGDLRLEGQMAVATVLISDIRGFTTLSEKAEPTTVLNWLNEYFTELVPVITSHGGVVDKFEGDAILAFFGILPRPLTPQDSAYQASRAAVEMLRVVQRLNSRRAKRGEPSFVTGIGVNTGPITAGGLGTADRLNYTIIGDAVNTTQRLEGFTRQFGESGAIISQSTFAALQERASEFRLESLGAHTFKGKSEAVAIYRLRASRLATVLDTPAG